MSQRRLQAFSGGSIAALALCLGVAFPPLATGAKPTRIEPRPLSDAERATVELAADAAARGAVAVWDRLAETAPLRTLGRDAALAEIAVRLGELDGASWLVDSLAPEAASGRALLWVRFASGIDDLLILDWRSEGGRWALAELRTGAESRDLAPEATASLDRSAGHDRWPWLLVLVGTLACVGPVAVRGPRGPRWAWGAAVWAGALGFGSCGGWAPAPAALAAAPAAEPLAKLAPLRRLVATGTDRAALERELADRPQELGAVHDLWQAQVRIADGDLNRAAELLASEPEPSPRPLADLLRARLAVARLDLSSGDQKFEQFVRGGLDSDSIRFEALSGHLLEGEVSLKDPWIERLVARRTRLAELWYLAAGAALLHGQPEEGERLFEVGWRLEPMTRTALLDDPVLGALATREAVFELIDFGRPEGSVSAVDSGSRAISLPPGAEAMLAGASLRIAVDGLEIEVPNGAAIAPRGAAVESAEARSERERRRALNELPRLERVASVPAANPGARDAALAIEAARALIEERRWAEVVRLTAGPFARPEIAGGELARLRARALVRSGRAAEARDLLVALAKAERGSERPRVATLYDLGFVMSELGELDHAIRLLRAADAQLPVPFAEDEIRRLEVRRELSAGAGTRSSSHFTVAVPIGVNSGAADRMVELLERERTRLLAWIPGAGSGRIEVELLPLRAFLAAYGELGISGLYDGKVRVPFFDADSFDPELVAIYAHEVAHAMLDSATGGRTPRWFSEGLAQHVETFSRHVNPMPDLDRTGRRISFTALEPILAGFAEPQFVELAYSEAAWSIAFLEAEHGRRALHRLQERFKAGLDSEAAIGEVLGLSLAELDRRFWSWGVSKAPRFRLVEGPRFDLDLVPVLSEH